MKNFGNKHVATYLTTASMQVAAIGTNHKALVTNVESLVVLRVHLEVQLDPSSEVAGAKEACFVALVYYPHNAPPTLNKSTSLVEPASYSLVQKALSTANGVRLVCDHILYPGDEIHLCGFNPNETGLYSVQAIVKATFTVAN